MSSAAPTEESPETLARRLLGAIDARGDRMLGWGDGEVALHVLWQSAAFLITVEAEAEEVLRAVEERAAEGGYVSRLTTRRAPRGLHPEAEGTFALVVCRAAPKERATTVRAEVERLLAPGGVSWIGWDDGEVTELRGPPRNAAQEAP